MPITVHMTHVAGPVHGRDISALAPPFIQENLLPHNLETAQRISVRRGHGVRQQEDDTPLKQNNFSSLNHSPISF